MRRTWLQMATSNLVPAHSEQTLGLHSPQRLPSRGWTVLPTGNVIVVGQGSTFTWLTPSPSKEMDLSGVADTVGSGIKQTLATVVGQTYDLKLDVYSVTGSIEINAGSSTWTRTNVSTRSLAETFTFTANSASTDISFISRAGIWNHIDNVLRCRNSSRTSYDGCPRPWSAQTIQVNPSGQPQWSAICSLTIFLYAAIRSVTRTPSIVMPSKRQRSIAAPSNLTQ